MILSPWLCLLLTVLAPAAGDMPTVDVLTFRSESGSSLVDVFIKLTIDRLVVRSGAEGVDTIEVSFAVIVEDSSGSPLLTDRWHRRMKTPPQEADGSEIYILDSSTLEVEPGVYTFVVMVDDLIGERRHETIIKKSIPSYNAPGLQLSDLLLSASMRKTETDGQFVRSGYQVAPNPDRVFGALSRSIYIYHEIYNPAMSPGIQDSFSMVYRILDDVGREVRAHAPVRAERIGEKTVRAAGLSIADLPPGPYKLSVDVRDVSSGLRATKQADFTVVPLRVTTEIPEFTDEQVNKSLDILSYLASSRERNLLESLDETGRRNFVRRYWMGRAEGAGSPIDGDFTEMMRRYDYANEQFSGHMPGWLTDRGRIYIMYGAPRDIERNVANPGLKDYEIWTYALEGETTFVFVDERGYGQYRLVHSTARDEIQNVEWEEIVRPHDSDF